MGDILSGVFGGGSQTTAQQKPDATAQALNMLKTQQLNLLYGGGSGLNWFAGPQPDIYTPTDQTQQLQQQALGSLVQYDPTGAGLYASMYGQGGLGLLGGVTGQGIGALGDLAATGQQQAGAGTLGALSNLDNARLNALASARQDIGLGQQMNQAGFQTGLGQLQGGYNTALGQFQGGYNTGREQFQGGYGTALGQLQGSYGQQLDALQNYISQVAQPQIYQQAALQGLEGGAAVPAALARATAEVGLPMTQQYLSALSGLGQQYLGGVGSLAGQYAGGIGSLAGQYAGGIGSLAGQYAGGEQALGQQQLATIAALNQAGLGQEAGLLGQQIGQQGQFGLAGLQGIGGLYGQALPQLGGLYQSIPGVYAQQQLTPQQAGLLHTQAATSLLPLSDYGRQLQEADLLRRQGLAQTALTGIPFTPGSSTQQVQSQQPLFNWFGQGSPQGAFTFGLAR